MTQLGEMVAFGASLEESGKCPFDHKKNSKTKPKKNVMPKWEKNDADELGKNLGDEYHFNENIEIEVKGKDYEAQYTPHHLIPGNASWPKTKLRKWVDKRSRHIKEHIGYDVNARYNGVSLPGIHGLAATGGDWKKFRYKKDYAFACMDAVAIKRQFHDSHPAYNDFVVGILDKVAQKLETMIKNTKYPGCSRENCAGRTAKKKPYDPPIHLLERCKSIALRLEGYLTGSPKRWKMPIFTSRFALMYKEDISVKEARKKLSDARKKAKQF